MHNFQSCCSPSLPFIQEAQGIQPAASKGAHWQLVGLCLPCPHVGRAEDAKVWLVRNYKALKDALAE